MGLLWAVLDGSGPLSLEEPELSLHEAIVRHVPAMLWKATRKTRRQIFVSTHSAALLSDEGIAAEEILLLLPTGEGTAVVRGAEHGPIRALLEGGLTPGEAVLPAVAPRHPERLLRGFSE